MKLRIKGNSIRLRLTQSEVTRVATEGALESQADFGTQTLHFAILARDDASSPSVSFERNTILVSASRSALTNWAKSEEIGLYGEQATSTGELLAIAVEKDFRCLDRSRAEDDEADAYPHPKLKDRKT